MRLVIRVPLACSLGMLAALIGLSSPLDASAGFIGLTDARAVAVTVGGFATCSNMSDTPDSSFAPFEAQINVCRNPPSFPPGGPITLQAGATASQTSSFSSTSLQGSGSVSTETGDSSTARSTYSITFEVDSATPFTLDGMLRAGRDVGGTSSVSLSRGTDVLFSLQHDRLSNPDPLPFSTSGVLAAGEYRLLVESRVSLCCGGRVSPSSYEFELSAVAVPEPSPHMLVGSGVAMLAWHRLRRAHRIG